MVFGWMTNETKSMYVARPADYANDLIYLHPDKSIPRGTKLTVRSDECALFFREGRYIGRINAGTVLLDTANIPFLGHLLVDRLTDANHFICEIFFVSLKETIFTIRSSALGQYKDKNSANVVSINGRLSYTVKVSDPAKLVIELGGQSDTSGAAIQVIFDGRMLNQFRKAVGLRTQKVAVLDVVSNVESEAISEEIKSLGHTEFSPLGIGIGRVFDVALTLDDESLGLLREFGKQEAGLAIQAKGMKLAAGEGFAEFNLIQGQRAALEGMGKGFGAGNGPMIMTGMNLGANLTGGTMRPSPRAPAARGSTVLSSQQMFVIKSDSGDTGPFSPRQIALLAISKGISLSEMLIRGNEDPDDVAFAADLEPQIAAEYKRRAPAAKQEKSPGMQAFDQAFSAAASDGLLTASEMEMLANLAVTFGLDSDQASGRVRILSMARSKNIA
ncbi:SPFH domain-containing protein, partial [bacterium]